MRNHHGKVFYILFLRLQDSHRVGGRGGFKTDREKDNLFIRISLRDLQRFKRRIHHAHIPAFGAHIEQVNSRAGHAQHIAVGCEDNFRTSSDCQCAINLLKRSYANGAAWPMH